MPRVKVGIIRNLHPFEADMLSRCGPRPPSVEDMLAHEFRLGEKRRRDEERGGIVALVIIVLMFLGWLAYFIYYLNDYKFPVII